MEGEGTEKQQTLSRETGAVALGGAPGPFRVSVAKLAQSQHSPQKGETRLERESGEGIF